MTQVNISRPLFVAGALAIVLGLIALIWPGISLAVIAVLWGIFALADGIASFSRARGARGAERFFHIVSGIIGLLAGLVVIVQPLAGMAVLTWVLGFWLVIRGIVEIIGAFSLAGGSSRVWLILAGLLWIIAGIVVMAHPGNAMVGIMFWLGILAIAWGIAFIVAGFSARSAQKNMR